MDIVERLAQQAAETINGGEFYDGTWYTEGQRQAWRKAMTPAADEIERLREMGKQDCDMIMEAATELQRLREALRLIAQHPVKHSQQWEVGAKEMQNLARQALGEKE